jgi:general secretion pathway protein G
MFPPLEVGFRRRRILIDGFQLRYAAEQLAFLFLLAVAVAAAVFGPVIIELRGTGGSAVAGHFLWLHTWFWPVAILTLAVAAGHAIWISHKIAGPLYRFRRVFELIAAGDLSPRVRIRRGDYLTEEAAAFDAALVALRERATGVHEAIAAVLAVAPSLDSLSPGDRAVLAASLARLDLAGRGLAVAADRGREAAMDLPAEGAAPVGRSPAAGFSVIELLIVAALVGVLAAIGVPTYVNALERARITRAIGDIRAIELELRVYQAETGTVPALLTDVRSTPTRDPWGREYVYTNLTTLKGKGKARKDRSLNPLNHDFDLYSVGKDGKSSTPLTAKASRDDVVRANDGGFVGLAAEY